MMSLAEDAAIFLETQRRWIDQARQTAAARLVGGMDLDLALGAPGISRREVVRRLRRVMERERLKGVHGRPGYSLDRHIALKQALDRLCPAEAEKGAKRNGARRRRRS